MVGLKDLLAYAGMAWALLDQHTCQHIQMEAYVVDGDSAVVLEAVNS